MNGKTPGDGANGFALDDELAGEFGLIGVPVIFRPKPAVKNLPEKRRLLDRQAR